MKRENVVGRANVEDTPELEAYYRETAPILPHYRALGRVYSVDGMAEIDVVTEEIEAVLAQLPEHPVRVAADPSSAEQ